MTFLTALLALQAVLAQSFVVKGNVISKEDNEPLIGVAIRQLENPANGVITDFDGNYAIEIKGKEATLSFTLYSGMSARSLPRRSASKNSGRVRASSPASSAT